MSDQYEEQFPTVDVPNRLGARYAYDLSAHECWGEMFKRPPFTDADSAMRYYEQNEGVMNAQERKAFMRGWRYQRMAFHLERLRELGAKRLKADDLEALAIEVKALADKWEQPR